MNASLDLLGPMAWPLVIFSILTLSLILERLAFYIGRDRLSEGQRRTILDLAGGRQWLKLENFLGGLPNTVANGLKLLLTNRDQPRDRVEQIVTLWLVEQRSKLEAHLRWLMLLAIASPLLGLLGTVLGMIEAFQDLAAHAGPVSPSLLAKGLQQAMLTTAFGLIIAIPALITGHAFRIRAGSQLESWESLLNRVHLAIENVTYIECIGANVSEKTICASLQGESS